MNMDCCPRCGGALVGDGYSTVRHCENIDEVKLDNIECAEPDLRVVFCTWKETDDR
jgi:hypothetical protein